MRGHRNGLPGAAARASHAVGDFTTTRRVVPIAVVGIGIGVVAAFVAAALLKLIGLFTNLFFFQRWSYALVSPAAHTLPHWAAVLVPVAGCIVIGLMARYGSERIRGHGIPEALEAILLRGSRIQPRVALLKPLSAAISIGSGGPFGAEGPIIMTGGAIGSIVAQLFHLTAAERKTLLVAGAAAGMSATFASPMAAVVLAIELLLFELKPRSFVPVALASATAAAVRHAIIGPGRIFTVAAHSALASSSPSFGPVALAACGLAGLAAGMLSAGMTASVYAAEDFFTRLPIHWMWWPALGGLVVGLGGLLCPQALGVGYDQIQALLSGDLPLRAMLLLGGVKLGIWAVSLGSGTSGGVLAPLLMLGAALGGILAPFLPAVPGGPFWPLVSMAAILAGTMRAPLTAVVFAMELTGRLDMLLPLLIASTVAHAFTVLALRRSILTEKMARRGFHVSREYAIDALEILFVREVMQTEVAAFPARAARAEASSSLARLASRPEAHRQRLYPALDDAGALAGVVTRRDLDRWLQEGDGDGDGDGAAATATLASIARPVPVVAFADEPLRVVIHRMAGTGLTRLPVVDRGDRGRLLGLVSLNDMLKARVRHIEEEQRRERVLPLSLLMPFGRPGSGRKRSAAAPPPPVAPEPRA